MLKTLILFGTRPEIIKLAPVIRRLEAFPEVFENVNISSSQHTSLLYPFTNLFGIRIDHDLQVMRPDQSPDMVFSRVLSALNPILAEELPDVIIVQGDTTTALAGAFAGFSHNIPVGHVEAGLRSGNPKSPFPEEMNRRLISQLATYHFAATHNNRRTLLGEGISEGQIFVTGNPVVDALKYILEQPRDPSLIDETLALTAGRRVIVVTTHRRESLGTVMSENLLVLRNFVNNTDDVSVIFPVHPNPAVVASAKEVLEGNKHIHLVAPLGYPDFIYLLSQAWLIVSDSGGIQEEAPTLGKPVLILRENTERPEAVETGVARLVGGDPAVLANMLDAIEREPSWIEAVKRVDNPFGTGDSAENIVDVLSMQCARHGTKERLSTETEV